MKAKVYSSFQEAAAFAKKSALTNGCTFIVVRRENRWVVKAPPRSGAEEYVSFAELEDEAGVSEQERLEAYEREEICSESIG